MRDICIHMTHQLGKAWTKSKKNIFVTQGLIVVEAYTYIHMKEKYTQDDCMKIKKKKEKVHRNYVWWQ